MIWVYRLFYPLFILILWGLSPFSSKIRRGLLGRIGLASRLSKTTRVWNSSAKRVWFHCSSAGEFEQALPLLDTLRKTEPHTKVILTYFSPSAEKAIRLETIRRKEVGLSNPWDFADFSPFDFAWSVQSFLSRTNPTSFVAIHRELWPEILHQCRAKGVSCFLFAAYFPTPIKQSHWIYRLGLRHLNQILTVDEKSRDHLLACNSNLNVLTVGDPRIERVIFRKNTFSKVSPWRSFFEGAPVFIGASLWDEDFSILLAGLSKVLESSPGSRLLLVPHEPTEHRLAGWKKALAQEGIYFRRWSHWMKSPDSQSHLLVDQVGLLAELYSIATCVLVGGSFKKRVHNVLEPLVYHCSLVTGPFIQNSLEATELASRGLLSVAQNSQDLTRWLQENLKSYRRIQALPPEAQAFFKEREALSKRYIQVLVS